ncbi:MAG: Nuclear transport factor 2 [Bogoriella megaspora]|nr:MAG: Nuclear transport factor 2 [Bogoriella megaspora]
MATGSLRSVPFFTSILRKYTNNIIDNPEKPQFQDIAEKFVKFYYEAFDGDRMALASLYKDQSMMTWQDYSTQGVGPIMEKLTTLPFSRVEHSLVMTAGEDWTQAVKAQPSNAEGGILVNVSGRVLVDEERNALNYTQTFQLMPDGQGSYFVFNDIFRLI